MERQITILDFDQTYHQQQFLRSEKCDRIELEEMPGTNLFCDQHALSHISQKLKQHRTNPITLLGSGNYHYVSYILLSQIQRPFTLVLFDHHTDMLPSPNESLISCGSWVYDSLMKLPFLKKVILIGVNDDWIKQVPSTVAEKVIAFPEQSLHQNNATLIHSIIEEMTTTEIYISIDKDVLDPIDAVTAWDHGTLRLCRLMEIVDAITQPKEVLGVDICGEYPVTPGNAYKRGTKEAVKKNSDANRFIVKHLNETVCGKA
ncbi:arginase family protein [Lentibacillus sp. L22]|uniref:arginase family protein n=1 Tax=Lentibacillus TaxID=175304 RepID=UPI0022B0BC4A|nr:arginase family protein [Lentibacillus daqui]